MLERLKYRWMTLTEVRGAHNVSKSHLSLPPGVQARPLIGTICCYSATQLVSLTQLDDLSPLYWDLCIDHLYFQHPENTEISCSYALALNSSFSIIISELLTMNIAEYAFSWQSEVSRASLTKRIEKGLRTT